MREEVKAQVRGEGRSQPDSSAADRGGTEGCRERISGANGH